MKNTGNPNHPVLREMESEWHKIVAIIMCAYGITSFELTPEKIALLGPDMSVVADARGGRFVIRLMALDEGMSLAKREGGMPV